MKDLPATTLRSRKEKIAQLLESMQSGLLERTEQVKLIMLAALAGEHVLLIGPPGTAKSELAKRLKNVFFEANYFERLLTRFSVPEEVFGPLSIKALEEDRYKRLTSGYLPAASVAFIDEIFKANSAILNSLLTLLNEREFDNGNVRQDVPLISVIAASNELPEGDELTALYDRFMLRSYVGPVSDDSFSQLLRLTNSECNPELEIRLSVEDLKEIQQLADKVELPESVISICQSFRDYLSAESIYVSDRRWRKIIKLMKVSAYTSGQTKVSNYDAWLLPHCLWNKPEEFEGLQSIFENAVAITGEYSDGRLIKILNALEVRLNADKANRSPKKNAKGHQLFLDENGKETINNFGKVQKVDGNNNPVYLDEDQRETTSKSDRWGDIQYQPVMVDFGYELAMSATKFSRGHIRDRLQDVDDLKASVSSNIDSLNEQLQSAKAVFNGHLWLDSSMLPKITQSLNDALGQSKKLLTRVEKVYKGFSELPQEQELEITDISDEASADALEGELV